MYWIWLKIAQFSEVFSKISSFLNAFNIFLRFVKIYLILKLNLNEFTFYDLIVLIRLFKFKYII